MALAPPLGGFVPHQLAELADEDLVGDGVGGHVGLASMTATTPVVAHDRHPVGVMYAAAVSCACEPWSGAVSSGEAREVNYKQPLGHEMEIRSFRRALGMWEASPPWISRRAERGCEVVLWSRHRGET